MKNHYRVIIIGGGAAGFAAASFLCGTEGSGSGSGILIIEKNRRPMQKLGLTGKGRCNLTNNCDVETALRNIYKNPAFMTSALNAFTPADTIAWFEEVLGVPLKTERGGRVFPVSDKAGDIVTALRRFCKATVITDCARELIIDNNGASRVSRVSGVKCDNGVYYADKVIVATGGVSYPKTGSDGDGYRLAKLAGHTVVPPKPALVPLETAEDCSSMAGLTLKNVVLTLTLKKGGKTAFREQGELLFTHFGVSGPLVLSASCYIGNGVGAFPCSLSIDLKPALDEKTLDLRLLRDFSQNKNRQLRNALSGILPGKLIEAFIAVSGLNPEIRVNEVTKVQRRALLELFKNFPLTVTALRPIDEAVITDGGVDTKELNPRTMESKLVKGLYFAGEVIDVAGFTGGFNLQIAFSTAAAAAGFRFQDSGFRV